MREGFFGLNLAVRGLYTAQKNLDIVGHNLNNINTPGYSRQVGVQQASKPMPLFDGTGMMGTGSEVVAVDRIRDEYLDFKYWSENVSFGEWDEKRTLLSDMEATFNEPSDSGFTQILDSFYTSLQELAKDPGSAAVRSLVRERGVTASKYFNSVAIHFEKLQSDINYRVKNKVEEINSYATQIQQLNRQIYSSELDGNTANDLRDQRTLLVDKLSKVINVDANEVIVGKLPSGRDDKHFVLTISGKALVDHFSMSKVAVTQRKGKLNEEDVDGLYDVGWEDGNQLDIKGGEMRAYLDIRDGNDGQAADPSYTAGAVKTPLYKGIPFYMGKLNEFVRTFAMAFNEGIINGVKTSGHADGYGLDPDGNGPGTSPTGVRFFGTLGSDGKAKSSSQFMNGADAVIDDPATPQDEKLEAIKKQYAGMTAKNFSITSDIISDYNVIAASDTSGIKGNIENLNLLIKMRHDPHMFNEGAPEDFMKSLVTTLGIDSQQADRLSSNQDTIVKQIETRRMSDSGVSVDEEMANLVKFQHAYNASAKMVTTMAEIYDTLINRVGVR